MTWMISHALQIPDVPMWVGFNSRIDDSNSPKQIISYLTPINSSPTNTSVVLETMKRSFEIAEELKQPYIQVTYDLAIAKVALQIQSTEKPMFDKLFIHLGPFHIMMAYFKAVGKVITDCGLTNVMVESNLIANGSLKGFLEGKHFNRCKRLHPLMALGLEVLHFQSFLQMKNIKFTDEMIDEVKRLQSCKKSSFKIENDEIKTIYEDYSRFKEQTLNGEHGKTSQFYLIYINLVNYYLTLSRSIRIGDFELFKYVLPKITNLFFTCNQPNYARWTVKYLDNLLKVNETHPGLSDEFRKGFFGIKRTDKTFSQQPIDLVLEQTINADAARRLTGVIHFTNSISARQRWARSHDVRATIISHVYEELGLQKQQDVSADLDNNNIKNSITQLQTFITTFDKFINPFSQTIPTDQLINISSGKAASNEVKNFLLNLEKIGDQGRHTFITECQTNISRFEKSIKKIPFKNFSCDYEKNKKVKIGGKIQEIKIQRDLFGRMLGISIDFNIDISKILSYPITPVPMSMCHLDGTICKTEKSALMKHLEKGIEHQPPPHIDVVIIDGFFLLHTMTEVPKTFGNISKKMLQKFCNFNASRIDIIFDQYFTPSIKDYERSLRQEFSKLDFTITGPDQVRPSDFTKELKNSKFKEALIDFFILHWASDEVAPLIGDKVINVNFKQCHSFVTNNDDKVICNILEDLTCQDHEEADTKIVYHLCNIEYEANIVIRASDTDIAAIILGHMDHIKNEKQVWMLSGTGNKMRYIDLTTIHNNQGNVICKSLPALHAMTGCDYNPAFFKKGKVKPFKLLKKKEEYQQLFAHFANVDFHNEEEKTIAFNTVQQFICDLYNVPGINDVDAARLQLFINNYTAADVNESFQMKLRNFDASNLPPCKSELIQHVLRTKYIASIWTNAHLKNPHIYNPEDY